MACYLINRSPQASVGAMVAEEVWTGVKSYKFWDPVPRKMVISRDAVFDEQSMLQQHQDKMPKIGFLNTLQMELELHPVATKNRGSSHPTSGGSTTNEQQAYNLARDREVHALVASWICIYSRWMLKEYFNIVIWRNRFTWSSQTGSQPRHEHMVYHEIEDMAKVPYASVVDCLMYEMVCTRSDLAYVVSQICKYMSKLGRHHLEAVKCIFKYLMGIVGHGVIFGSQQNDPSVVGYVDSDYAVQSIVTLSTTEAEYITVGEAAKEALWLNRLA
ncbi:UNVERIFIED_CONTAM: Copia protein [Sesamum calycinum]|uniref:Copia protein n=1 Tax=Sesamum calycinum TaxID=2727403 RepID=A0AAW2SVU4_9LAMI